ncbi:gas vesicle structural protein GvpA [Mycolicibacterium monacense]|uniref:Gas vesicle protein A n=4 Tax=Mycobacteriaceae TaxID=1762 RepID=GVPA_MYCSJ|nr:gas vesicle structural protein GvpA [Mycolicibacterium monacense]A1UFH1.1 RecName: Full=Gas vesicle protein A; Short=GvpA [Mycobacterium sp. KMS]A3PZ32.1 RecName: Full=Gas vesicle protein A; Short=GvpA [Mycobacterium sp. JLS]Q1B9J2.1 RecName: Full=Gas vesicle protein A; Short=GvpA [Mycobacterium sp. MCS]MDA4105113.1 gas vesicle protein [Mycolicibacterium monacense DSM 44395]ORB19542.1 gas vesicle structural protein [Mycolicibacterium monacense DSM 44395]QHP86016.1 gas vesicle structural pr
MSTAIQPAGTAGGGGSDSNGLADVVDTILDKGLVLDAYVRVSVVGIEILTVDARVVVASVDTYLRYADAVNRLDIVNEDPKSDLGGLVGDVAESATSGVAKGKTTGVLEAAGEKLGDMLTSDEPEPRKATRVRSRRADR